MGKFVFKLPDVGEGTAEAEIVAWHVAVGERVEEDAPLVDVMTDKATVEMTSPVSGVVRVLNGEPGEMAAVGAALVELEVEGAGGEASGEPLVSAPSGERTTDPRDTLPTTPLTERPHAPTQSFSPAHPRERGDPDLFESGAASTLASGEADSEQQKQVWVPAYAGMSEGGGDYQFKLPDVGEGTAEAEITAWHVAPGDRVEEDQPLVDVMTDKATVEMTSPVSGVVVAIHGEVGDSAAVGSVLVEFSTSSSSAHPGEGRGPAAPGPAAGTERINSELQSDWAPASAGVSGEERGQGEPRRYEKEAAQAPLVSGSPVNGGTRAPSSSSPAAPSAASLAGEVARRAPARRDGGGEPRTTPPGERPLASPAVRRRALDLGIKLAFVPGSGPAGRIEHADLDAFLARGAAPVQPAPPAPDSRYARREGADDVKVIGLRRRIAQQMQEAKRRIPHFAYVEEVDMTALEELRAHLNATHKDRPKLTVLPFFMRALVRVLPDYPQINATFDDEAGVVHRWKPVHIGVATQTANGLIVPVVRHAEALDLWAAAAEVARVSAAARENKAKREELTGSTITLTSLGPLGGIATTPVINHPEVAIIGPNKILERPVVRGGAVVVRKMMNLSSSFDHRVVDGYDAAEFIQRVKGLLENPAMLFIE